MQFQVVSKYRPAGDQPEAIGKIADGILRGDRFQTLMGVTGSGKTFTMAMPPPMRKLINCGTAPRRHCLNAGT